MDLSHPDDLPPLDTRLTQAQTELDVLYQFGAAIHAPRDWMDLYRFFFKQAERTMTIDAAFISFLVESGTKLQTVLLLDGGIEYPPDPAWSFSDIRPSGWVVLHAEAVRFADFEQELALRFPHLPARVNTWAFGDTEKRSRAWMTVPMLIDREVRGIINVQSYQIGVYGEDEERLLMTLGSMLAIAVNQSQLVSELETMREALSTPFIPVSPQLTILPLIGELDSARMALVQRKLLTTIERQRVRHVVIDLTGVTEMHAESHRLLIRLIRAVALLGTTCSISGVHAELARTLAANRVDLTGLTVVQDVEQGLIRFGALQRSKPR